MSLSVHSFALDTFRPMLGNLSAILQKGLEHAERTGLDPLALASSRLAADMLPLTGQVQIACDKAKNAAARLAGREPPYFEDLERTIAELRTRIARTLEYIDSIPESEYAGAEARIIELPLPQRKMIKVDGVQFIRDWMLPNFFFHVVTAYDILRHNGVDLGKRDYLGHAVAYIRQLE